MTGRAKLMRTVAVIALLATAASAHAFPPAKPYDPRPLMKEAEAKTKADKFTFLVFGDAECRAGFNGVMERAKMIDHAFVLVMGDMVTVGGNPAHYDKLEKQFGDYMRKVPCWPCYGNHENKKRGMRNYLKFYGMPSAFYSFDFRNIRVITLKAEMGPGIRGGQAGWLEKQLAEGKKAGKLLFVRQHAPCYTIGARQRIHIPNRPSPISKLCKKYGVVANFAGHDHIYYRTRRDGIWYIVQGGGGDWIYPLRREREAIKGDVYYGGVPKDRRGYGSTSWKLVTPEGVKKKYEKPKYMLTAVSVDGTHVIAKTVTADGEVLDEVVLKKGERSK